MISSETASRERTRSSQRNRSAPRIRRWSKTYDHEVPNYGSRDVRETEQEKGVSAMTADALTRLCLRYRCAFFKAGSTIRRLLSRVHWSSPQKLLAYLMLNVLANRETRARRRIIIGGSGPFAAGRESVPESELQKVL